MFHLRRIFQRLSIVFPVMVGIAALLGAGLLMRLDHWDLRGALVWLVLLLVLIGLSLLFIQRMVMRPLRKMTGAIQRISAGDTATQLPLQGEMEIVQLAEAINQVMIDLRVTQEVLQQRLDEMATLGEISATISTTLELEKMLPYLANHLGRLVNGTGAFIALLDEASGRPYAAAAYGSFDQQYRQLQVEPGEPTLTAAVLRARRPITVYDAQDTPYISRRIASQFPDKSLLGVPLIVNDQPIGAAMISETRFNRNFTDHEIQLALSAAGQIAAAINNARLFALHEAERNRLNDTLNAVSDAILVSKGEMVDYVNPAFPMVTGFNPEDILSEPFWNLILADEEEIARWREEIAARLGQGRTWRKEVVGRRPDGATYDADVVISGVRSGSSANLNWVASIRDITGLKELDRMKNRFVSNVSHELRTPLSVIHLNTDNLLKYYDRLRDEQRKRLVEEIHAEANTLHQLIEDLLSLSRLDSGRVQMRWMVFDLGMAVQEVANHHRSTAEAKSVVLEMDCGEPGLMVNSDRDQLNQVIRNLMSNAIKFTPGGGKVSVQVTRDKEWAVCTVADNGIGIPEEDMPRLFERFFRTRLAVEQEIPGTGLGLAISREIVQRLGGSIELSSQVGMGTTFRFTLPVFQRSIPNVLVVDDDSITLKILSHILGKEHQVFDALDGDTAWDRLQQTSVNLAVIDLQLPDIPGWELINKIRQEARYSNLPVLAISADSQELAEKALFAGADDFLAKPISPDVLLETVRRLIQIKE